MNPVFKKMNFKGQSPILVLNAPASFHPAMKEMEDFTSVHKKIDPELTYAYSIAFCRDAATVQNTSLAIQNYLSEDAILYFAYPKKSSKVYKTDITRDNGWEALGALGYEPVRQVAIDDDWSGIRFRKVEKIRNLSRNSKMLLSDEGRRRHNQNEST